MDVADPGLYGRSFASVYDYWYLDHGDTDAIVEALVERLPQGATIIELGSGTGRIATPLEKVGFAVIGLDSSLEMLSRAPDRSTRMVADMAAPALRARSADAVLIAYNTLFNLAGLAQQQKCMVEVARLLRRGGTLAIESFIGAPTTPGVSISIRSHHVDETALVAIVTEPVVTGPTAGSIAGTHVEILPQGTFSRPWLLSYLGPDDLDAIARNAGLALSDRFGHWDGTPFDPAGDGHVSWYRPT